MPARPRPFNSTHLRNSTAMSSRSRRCRVQTIRIWREMKADETQISKTGLFLSAFICVHLRPKCLGLSSQSRWHRDYLSRADPHLADSGFGPGARSARASLAFGRDVLIVLGHCLCFSPVGFGVSVWQIFAVSGRRCLQSMGMLDRTKMLFGPRCDFRNEGQQSVGIGAINTSDLLDGVEIGQHAPIEYQVVFPGDLGNSVEGKADKLVEGNRSIQQQKGKHAKVNEGRRQDYQPACIAEVFPTGDLEATVFDQVF